MTIIEAMKSYKPFRRKHDDINAPWFYELEMDSDNGFKNLKYSDVLATDWEVQEQKIELTLYDIRAAWNNYVASCYDCLRPDSVELDGIVFKQFVRSLGFTVGNNVP